MVGAVNGAAAQDKIRIGLIYTLTGPAAVLGQQSKNGFELALKDLGGKMGGKEVELFVVDDELKPDVAIQKVKELLDKDKVDIVVGPIFSNMLQAIHKPVMDSGKILISTNAGASSFAGAACNAEFLRDLVPERPDLRDARRDREQEGLQDGLSPWCRTIRPARTRSPASSAPTRARSSKSRWCRSTAWTSSRS